MTWKLIPLAALCALKLVAQNEQAGKATFEGRCAACHGDDGNGGEFAAGIVVRIALRSNEEVMATIKNGLPSRGMPSFSLGDAELKDLVAHLRALKPPRRGAMRAVQVSVETTDGRTLKGVSVNRTATDMQLRTADGKVALLRKEGDKFRVVTSQADWPSYDGQLNGNRFSALKQITPVNAAKITPKWIYSLSNVPVLEGTPLVVEGVMYITAANQCYALDAGTGREIWRFERPATKGLEGKVNRGAAVSGGRIFMGTDNAHLIALDRYTGALLWEAAMADHKQNYFGTSAPLVVGNLVVAGIGGGDSGVRGFLSAYDVATGKEAWRFWTIPAKGEPGSEPWTGKDFAHPGGATWFTGSFDPDMNQVLWQVGNPGPDHNGDNREGDNLYSDSVIALDAATGKLKWHYQFTPHDVWDWDAQEPLLVVNANWEGKPRKLLLQANRNGFFYVIDRTNGKVLLAKPFISKLTWASGIDANGRPIRTADQEPAEQGTKTCPAVLGGTNWWSAAFDPGTSLFYVQTIESCGIYRKGPVAWEAGRGFMGGSSRGAPSDPPERILRAIDINTGKIAWEMAQVGSGESRSGTLATAGGVVVFGEDSGALMVADSKSGKPLWSFQTNQSLRASPMTYMFDGKQYLAIASGTNVLAFALGE